MPCRRPVLAGELSVSQCDGQVAGSSPNLCCRRQVGCLPARSLCFAWGWHGAEPLPPACTEEDPPPTAGPCRAPATPGVRGAQPPEVTGPPWPCAGTGDPSGTTNESECLPLCRPVPQ